MRRIFTLIVAVAAAAVCASSSKAQTSGQTTYGSYSNTYTAPAWGQSGQNKWNTYSGNIGQGGWQYARPPQANESAQSGPYPNANSRPFGSSPETNPLTSRGRRY